MNSTGPSDPSEIRRDMKKRRRSMDVAVALDHGERVARHLVGIPEITQARNIGAYIAFGGELDPAPSLALLTASTYLPLVGEDFSMAFKLSNLDYPMVANRYGIDEPPASAPSIAIDELDVVLVPLVAFDRRGARLGMGAGYYDRCFASRKSEAPPPLLIGLAHGMQEVELIESQPWDVALDLIVTEDGVIRII